jgi:hypothetical protein
MTTQEASGAWEDIKPWVVLQAVNEPGQPVKYLQQGPYSLIELRSKLYRGEVKFTDYVWKKGLENWTLLSEISALQSAPESAPIYSRKDPLQGLVQEIEAQRADYQFLRKEDLQKPEKIEVVPPEALTGDLAESSTAFVPNWRTPSLEIIDTETESETFENFQPMGVGESAAHVSMDADVTSQAFKDLRPQSRLWRQWQSGIMMAAAIGMAGLGVYFILNGWGFEGGASAIGTSSGSAPSSAKMNVADSSASDAKVVWPAGGVQPTKKETLEITGLDLDRSEPKLVVHFQSSIADDVEVWLMAGPGAVLNHIRIERYSRWPVNSEGLHAVDLTQWKLPPGVYSVFVRHGKTSIRRSIFLGQRNQQFNIALAKHRAILKRQAVGEKTELQALALNLVREFEDLLAKVTDKTSGKLSLDTVTEWERRWDALVGASVLAQWDQAQRQKLVFADSWQRLNDLANEVKGEALGLSNQGVSTAKTSSGLVKMREFEKSLEDLQPWDKSLF